MRSLDTASFTPDEPVDCYQAPGTEFRREGELCWYALPVFRKLYPEYKDLNEKDLSEKLYAKLAFHSRPSDHWTLVMEKTALALGPPVAVLIIGWHLFGRCRTSGGRSGRFYRNLRNLEQPPHIEMPVDCFPCFLE